MKNLTVVFFLAFGIFLTNQSFAQDDPTPVLKMAHFHTAYVPDGFDSNDLVQIVGEGMFTSTCYKPGPVDVRVDQENKTIEINPQMYFYDSDACLLMLVPYHSVIDLGILKPGTYTITEPLKGTDLGKIKIRQNTSVNADDFLYAPLSQAFYKHENDKQMLTLSGQFTNSCQAITKVIVNEQPRVITVQPITELLVGEDCVDGQFSFEKKVELPKLTRGMRYLLHVRTLNGKAINNLIDIE